MTKNLVITGFLLIISFLIIVLFSPFIDGDYKKTLDYVTLLLVAVSCITSILAAETAQKSREDAIESHKIAQESINLAQSSLDFTKNEFYINRRSFLSMSKDIMKVPLIVPFKTDITNVNMKNDNNFICIKNKGAGDIHSLEISMTFSNYMEFNDFNFNSENLINYMYEIESSITEYYPNDLKDIIPSYSIEAGFDGTYFNLITKNSNQTSPTIGYPTKISSPEKVYYSHLKTGENVEVELPVCFSILCHHFFIEQSVLEAELCVTPNPRLHIKIQYVEESLEHINEIKKANRIKEFEISCIDKVSLNISEDAYKGDMHHENFSYCNFKIKTIGDYSKE